MKTAARDWFGGHPLGLSGPHCTKCGSLEPYKTKKPGVYRCKAKECRKDFTVMTGSVMERSHAKLIQWAAAFYLCASSKKGFSAHQLHRTLGCKYETAWFLNHRVMEVTRQGGLQTLPSMGGEGQIVEVDEVTYFGGVESAKMRTNSTSGRKFTQVWQRRSLQQARHRYAGGTWRQGPVLPCASRG